MENGYVIFKHMSKVKRQMLDVVCMFLTIFWCAIIILKGVSLFFEILSDVLTNKMNIWSGIAEFLINLSVLSNIPRFLLLIFVFLILSLRKNQIKKTIYIVNYILEMIAIIILCTIAWSHLYNLLMISPWQAEVGIMTLQLGDFLKTFYPIGLIVFFLYILDWHSRKYTNKNCSNVDYTELKEKAIEFVEKNKIIDKIRKYELMDEVLKKFVHYLTPKERNSEEQEENVLEVEESNITRNLNKDDTSWNIIYFLKTSFPAFLFVLIALYILGTFDYNVWGTIYKNNTYSNQIEVSDVSDEARSASDYILVTEEELFRNPSLYDHKRIQIENVLFMESFGSYCFFSEQGICEINYNQPTYDEYGNEFGNLLNGDEGDIEGTFYMATSGEDYPYIIADRIVISTNEQNDYGMSESDNTITQSSDVPYSRDLCGTYAFDSDDVIINIYNDSEYGYCADLWGRGGKMNTTVFLYESMNGYDGYTNSAEVDPMLTISEITEKGMQIEFWNIPEFTGWYTKQ